MFSYNSRLLVSVALLSAALIAYQVAIMQLLSLVQWYHYANMIISIALLGFGAAGTFLALKRNRLLEHSGKLLPVLMICCGFTMSGAVWLSRSGFARFDSYLLFVDRSQWLSLLATYLLFFFPFFIGALTLGIVFVKYVSGISSFYFSNLLGSALGAFAAVMLAWYCMPASFPAVVACIAIAAGIILLQQKNSWPVISLALLSSVLTGYMIISPPDLSLSSYKSLSRSLQLPASKIILQRTSPHGLVQVVSADALRYGPGLSLAFTGEVPVKKAVFNNGDWYGPVVSWNPKDSFHLLDYTTIALPYVLSKRDTVLVLHAGTGFSVSHALSRGAEDIDAVEPHAVITDILKQELAKESDSFYLCPQVSTHNTEPRTFLSVVQKKYDLIQLPPVGSFGGGTGLNAMREEYLLTKEAFMQMWDLLENNGVISITAWMDHPYRTPLKIVATLAETLEDAGFDHREHLAAVRSWATITFILKRSPLTATDTARLRKFCDGYYFDPLLLPGLKKEERNFYNQIDDSSFFTFTDLLLTPQRNDLYKTYNFHLNPATDDKPYFSQFLRWQSLPRLAEVFGGQNVSFLELGWLISVITFIQIAALAVLLIIMPLLKTGWSGGGRGWTFFYFSGLGIGYMLVEIVFIQRFTLFFGNPVYSSALVIGFMMLASGAGSYASGKFQLKYSLLQRILSFIVLLLLLYTFFLTYFLQSFTGLPGWSRLVISFIAIALPAFFMGMPFPLGLSHLARVSEKNLPWAWGLNGCMSVISAALASLLAVEAGFTAVMLLATLSYIVCLLSMYRSSKSEHTT